MTASQVTVYERRRTSLKQCSFKNRSPNEFKINSFVFLMCFWFILSFYIQYTMLVFSHISMLKINLFFFSNPIRRRIPSRQFPSLFCCNLLNSTNFEAFPLFAFQMGTIPKFFKGAFLRPFFACGHTSSTVCILYNLKQKV